MYVLWILPHLGVWLFEKNPEKAFIYFEFASKHFEFGSGWMVHSDWHMTHYQKLQQIYTKESHPDVWDKIDAMSLEQVIEEVNQIKLKYS